MISVAEWTSISNNYCHHIGPFYWNDLAHLKDFARSSSIRLNSNFYNWVGGKAEWNAVSLAAVRPAEWPVPHYKSQQWLWSIALLLLLFENPYIYRNNAQAEKSQNDFSQHTIARAVSHKLKSQPHKQHIWFLPTRKPTQKKPKELFFANARKETH